MQKQQGNILSVKHGIIVHQVNAQGVMGSGVAALIRSWYPRHYDDYIRDVKSWEADGPTDQGRLLLGKTVVTQFSRDFAIVGIVGQQFYGRDGKRYTSYDALDTGFAEVAKIAKANNLPVHYPMIGAGLGGGDWSIISAIINARLDTIDHTLWVLP